MSDKNDESVTEIGTGGAQWEQVVARFEDAWRRGETPAFDDYFSGDAEERHAILVGLVQVDLEYRLKAGELARVEDYLERHPELTQDDDALVELICAEYSVRHVREPDLAVEEYAQRFPAYQQKLAGRLTKKPAPRPRRQFPVRLNCPHCQNPIAIVDDTPGDEIVCPSCGSSFRLEPDQTVSWKPDKLPQLGKFELLEAVGRGAFGTVYRARDTGLDRIVAVKVPRSGTFATQEDEDRFVREARSVAQLHHSGIVPVYEVGHGESFPYIVAQYVEGVTLSDALTGRRSDFANPPRSSPRWPTRWSIPTSRE